MKKSVNETLKQAVEQLFVRVHVDLLETICDKSNCPTSCESFNSENPKHLKLVSLSKEKIGFDPSILNDEIFARIIQVYADTKKREKQRFESRKR